MTTQSIALRIADIPEIDISVMRNERLFAELIFIGEDYSSQTFECQVSKLPNPSTDDILATVTVTFSSHAQETYQSLIDQDLISECHVYDDELSDLVDVSRLTALLPLDDVEELPLSESTEAVSYTHLTLPTILLV